MSSYLTFYGIKGEQKFEIFCFSRSHPIYQEFWENLSFNTDEGELTEQSVDKVVESMLELIDKTKRRIEEYEKHANGNEDLIMEIIDSKEFLESEKETYYQIKIFYELLSSISYGGEHRFDKIIFTIE
jgi:Mg2+ and Co2+ transporter CorA